MTGLRVVFMGTPDFAVPTVEALLAEGTIAKSFSVALNNEAATPRNFSTVEKKSGGVINHGAAFA